MFDLEKVQEEENKIRWGNKKKDSNRDTIDVKRSYQIGDEFTFRVIKPDPRLVELLGFKPYVVTLKSVIDDPVKTFKSKAGAELHEMFDYVHPRTFGVHRTSELEQHLLDVVGKAEGYMGGGVISDVVQAFRNKLTPTNPKRAGIFKKKEKQIQKILGWLIRQYGNQFTQEELLKQARAIRTIDQIWQNFYRMPVILMQEELQDGYSVPLSDQGNILEYKGMFQNALWNAKEPTSLWARALSSKDNEKKSKRNNIPMDFMTLSAVDQNVEAYDIVCEVVQGTAFGKPCLDYKFTPREVKSKIHPDYVTEDNNIFENIPSLYDTLVEQMKPEKAIAAWDVWLGLSDKDSYESTYHKGSGEEEETDLDNDEATDETLDVLGDTFGSDPTQTAEDTTDDSIDEGGLDEPEVDGDDELEELSELEKEALLLQALREKKKKAGIKRNRISIRK